MRETELHVFSKAGEGRLSKEACCKIGYVLLERSEGLLAEKAVAFKRNRQGVDGL